MTLTLVFSVDGGGHLVAVPLRPTRPLTTLAFLPHGATVSAPACGPVLLSWEAYGRITDAMDGPARPDGWAVVPWTAGRAGPIGVAVRVSGALEDATDCVFTATTSRWRRFSAGASSTLAGRKLPILTHRSLVDAGLRELSLLVALSAVLHDMPELRPRLGDVERVRRLASDLRARPLTLRASKSGAFRDSVDIHAALVSLGYVHRYTRPLAASTLPSVTEVTKHVVDALQSNPYRAGREVDLAQVVQIVRRDYTDVEPWPFAALVED